MEETRKPILARFLAPFMELFGLSHAAALGMIGLVAMILIFAVSWFFYSAPPRVITISAGTPGSSFDSYASKYADILLSNHITLKILSSQGSSQNLRRLTDPSFRVDVGFVQSGITDAPASNRRLFSLGSISYQPLLVFYRAPAPITLLSELNGKRIAIGAVGSGTRSLALMLLQTNGIAVQGPTKIVDLDAGDAAKALLDNQVDAIFLMGDSASPQLMKQLLLRADIQLLDFVQADGYTRKFSYLNKLELPRGSIDFGKNIPTHDVPLIGPTVELLAREELNPVLCDLLLDAARLVHGTPNLLRRKNEFPAAIEHDYPISVEAARYYKSGKTFTYRHLPFRLASIVNRIVVVLVPLIVLLIPGMRLIPALFRWRVKLRIYRWYRALLALERELLGKLTPVKRQELLSRLDSIEKGVSQMRVPASFADQFYSLRGTIDFVRNRLVGEERPNP